MSLPVAWLAGRRSLRILRPIVIALPLLFAGNVAAQDLTGHWYVAVTPGTFADVVQTGNAVSLTWTEGATTYDFQGTLTGTHVSATYSGFYLALDLTGGGNTLSGVMVQPGASSQYRRFSRCECYDENASDGDGCDYRCRVETCFSCTGEPSLCSPQADATPCDDRNDCTQGESCSSAVCGGGSPIVPCVNLSGLWREIDEIPDFSFHSVSSNRYEQREGELADYGPTVEPGEDFYSIGSIDAATGAMSLSYGGGPGLCTISRDFTGSASLDNLTFAGGGAAYTSTPHVCLGFSYTLVANRCDEVAGCDLTDCGGIADGSACDDGNPCTEGETCAAGICGEGHSPCRICEVCEGSGTCVTGPRTGCLQTTRPTGSVLQFTDTTPDDKDQMRWAWKKGVATEPADFGDPALSSDVGLCVFDESTPVPNLVFGTSLPRGGYCSEPPCWTSGDGKLSYKDSEDHIAGITNISIRSGQDGQSTISMRARGTGVGLTLTGLPSVPIAVPLRAQFQVRDGACFEATFGPDGIKKNADGLFRASGGTD